MVDCLKGNRGNGKIVGAKYFREKNKWDSGHK